MNALAIQEQEVLDVGELSLDELARVIQSEHELALQGLRASLSHALRVGEALLAAQKKLPWGQWSKWWQENCSLSQPTVYGYMRLAEYKEVVSGKGFESQSDAHAWLDAAGLTRSKPKMRLEASAALQRQARKLRSQGLTYQQIADALGVSLPSAIRWTDPAARKRELVRKRRIRAQKKALEREEQAKATKEAVRKAGGALAEAYAVAERMQDVLGQAHSEATDSEARRALSMAGAHYRKMRDEIVRALGVS